jgi:peptidyl-prolyl cis-trans isomerase SurA
MYRILFLLLLCVGANANIIDGVAILVQDQPITMQDITNSMNETHLDQNKTVDLLIRKKLENQEILTRKISVSDEDTINEIKRMAALNNMSVAQFYEAVANSQNLTSEQVQKEMKDRLLSQKLFQAIAYTHMDEPDMQEIKDYYELNKEKFNHPQSFSTTIFEAKEQSLLQQKIDNPMFYSPEIGHKDQLFEYNKIAPQLAEILSKTELNHFTEIIPNGKDGFVCFYIQGITQGKDQKIEDIKAQIENMIMADKREQILKEYFDRARVNANIQILRLPQTSKN